MPSGQTQDTTRSSAALPKREGGAGVSGATPPEPASGDGGGSGQVSGFGEGREFATDDLVGDLTGRSVRGGALTVVVQAAKFVLQLGATVVLARLLTPADFGLFAMVIAITGFAAKFKDFGLSTATVQRDEINHEQVSALFWINVAMSIGILVLLVAAAPGVAWMYGEPRVAWVMVALAAIIVLGGLTVQHQALLRRRMRFGALACIEIVSIVGGVATAVTMAVLGAGVWALVGQAAAIALISCALAWAFSPWRPTRPRRARGVGGMLRFGGGMSVFHLMDYAVRNLDNVLVGAVLGASTLGIYNKAYNLLMMPIRQFNAPIGGVLTPALSRLQNDPARFRTFFTQTVAGIAFVTVPVVAFLFADARNAVLTVLGDQWLEAVSVFRYLAPAALFTAVVVAPTWLCLALGNSGRAMRWSLVSAPLTLTAVAVALPFGINMVALAFSLSWTPAFLAFVVYASRGTPVSVLDMTRAAAPAAGASAIAATVAWLLSARTSEAFVAPGALLLNAAVFALVYLLGFGALGGLRAFPLQRVVTHLFARAGARGAAA